MSDPFLGQSFQFDWNRGGQPVPITAQCETLYVEWGKSGLDDLPGPDHFAPYSVAIFTSMHNVPILVPMGSTNNANLTIPLPPNTQYQMCMYDAKGNTGGCQDIYTVYQSPTISPTCENWTTPDPLNVIADKQRYAWVGQCDKVKLTFASGQPPYQVSVLPSFNTPHNVSGITGNTFEWQNILGRPASFFISVADANGQTWSQGPMYSGRGPTDCLDYVKTGKVSFSNIGMVIGVAIGIFVAGSLLAALLLALYRWKFGSKDQCVVSSPDAFITEPQIPTDGSANNTPPLSGPNQTIHRIRQSGGSRFLEDYNPAAYTSTISTEDQMTEAGRRSNSIVPGRVSTTDVTSMISSSRPDGTRASSSRVYVVHGDGPPPATIYSDSSTRVIELPPSYDPSRPAPGAPAAVTSPTRNRKRSSSGAPSLPPTSPRSLEKRPEPSTPMSSVGVLGSDSGPSHETSPPLVSDAIARARRALPAPPGGSSPYNPADTGGGNYPSGHSRPPEKSQRGWGSM